MSEQIKLGGKSTVAAVRATYPLCFVFALLGVTTAQELPKHGTKLTDAAIQSAIDSGRGVESKKLWKSIEKHRGVKINGYSIGGDTVAKRAVFMTPADVIAFAASDAKRRHQILTLDTVKGWPDLGATRVMLTAEATGMYKMNLPKWQAPAVHMTITADGTELQPVSEGATKRTDTTIGATEHGIVTNNHGLTTYTPLYQSALYDVAQSRTWFSFYIPAAAESLKVTVISADGHEKSKNFGMEILHP
jgi:hypothetical protein